MHRIHGQRTASAGNLFGAPLPGRLIARGVNQNMVDVGGRHRKQARTGRIAADACCRIPTSHWSAIFLFMVPADAFPLSEGNVASNLPRAWLRRLTVFRVPRSA